ALSGRLDVEVDRGGKVYAMSFQRGQPGEFADTDGPDPTSPFTPADGPAELRVVGKAKRGVTGTRVRYWADPQIFVKGSHFSLDVVNLRPGQSAFLGPGLALSVTDLRPEGYQDQPAIRTYKYDGGISEFVEYLAQDQRITDVFRLQG